MARALLAALLSIAQGSQLNLSHWLNWVPDLGAYSFPIRDKELQEVFDLGMFLIYNFDQLNARSAFQEATRLQEACAMCHWGMAHAYGPTLNAPVKSEEELAAGYASAKRALDLLELAPQSYSPKERLLIRSMAVRYPKSAAGEQAASYKLYSQRYAELLAEMKLQEDPDVKVFHAEALMILMCSPNEWHFYDSRGDSVPSVPKAETLASTKMLKEALNATNQSHRYAQHLLIHSTEMSNVDAFTALDTAAHLIAETKGLNDQHLQHMTSHTYLRTGRYHEALMSNILAQGSDSAYLRHHWMPYGPGHNAIFLVCCALWGGERAAAYKYVQVAQKIFETFPAQPDFPDGRMAWNYPMLVALRFGDWKDVAELAREPPEGFDWVYGHRIIFHFSLAIAECHLGNVSGSRQHLTHLQHLLPLSPYQNLSLIANHTASAVLAMAEAQQDQAVQALAAAADLELAMPYGLPPNWLLPSRECYGHALLLTGRHAEAEQVFRAALTGQSFHAEPRCGWALLGLKRSLQLQGVNDEARALTREIQEVWRFADVPLRSPCLHMDVPLV